MRIWERIGSIVNSAERRKHFVADVIQLLCKCLRIVGALPGWLDPEAERPSFETGPERQSGVILASILRHFGPEMAQKRLKMVQNRGVLVTCPLTMYFCIAFILCDLC